MLAFLGPDLATVVVSLVLFSICLAIVGRAAVRRHKGRSGGCGCGCPGCTGCSGCPGCSGSAGKTPQKH